MTNTINDTTVTTNRNINGITETSTGIVTNTNTSTGYIIRKIGNTIYHISVQFSDKSKENLNDKILRLATNDLTLTDICGTLRVPQTGRLLEGGSLL